MNDNFTSSKGDESIAQKLNQVSEKTNVDAKFAAELEERLKNAHPPKVSGLTSSFRQISPTLRWVALLILLGLVLSWSIRSLIPAPQPAVNGTPAISDTTTPAPELIDSTVTAVMEDEEYDWRGTKLYLAAPLPESPTEANVSSLKDEQPASIDNVRKLASQFGIVGEIYQTPGILPDTIGYVMTDGKQRLYVLSDVRYDYYSDYGAYHFMSGAKNISDERAAAVIDQFMKSHGLNFKYRLENSHIGPGIYYVLPLTSDGLPVYHDYNIPARLEFTIDENEQVILVMSYRVEYEVLGPYGIRTAEEAFQQVLDDSNGMQNGVLEIMRSAGMSNAGFWSRSYPDGQTITLYAQPTSYASTEPGGAPFVSVGQFTATGNISGIENTDSSTYVEATGQFITEEGFRKFNVESWKVTSATETALSGSLRREGDQTILTADDGSGEYIIEDAPVDLPLSITMGDEHLAVYGFMSDGKFNWTSIQYYPSGASGGGGGNGTGFYQLNLSGAPAPIPTVPPQTTQGTVEYIVKEGDTILSIAQAFGLGDTPEKILQANNWLADEGALIPGKTLIIPMTRTDSGASQYIVQENDTLSSIAFNFGISVDELKQANGITDDMVFAGQTLLIPTDLSQSQNPLIGTRFENQRGIFTVNIYRKPDGTERKEYGFVAANENENYYLLLVGEGLQQLEKYHNRPVNIWATITKANQFGGLTAQVDRFEVPFPDLSIRILKGTQQVQEFGGQSALTFVADDGTTYVQMGPAGDVWNEGAMFARQGDQVFVEALIIPDETFAGYPTLRTFAVNYIHDPITGQANEMTVTADQPYVMDEVQNPENYSPPSVTIETIELAYYVPDPHYGNQNSNLGPRYIQPAWRFYGHYSDGSEVEFLVQALKQEFLLPELAPYTPPG